jgi:hypothetical protein
VRLAAVIGLPVLLVLSGAVYFFAKPKEDPRLAALVARMDQPVSPAFGDGDAVDTELVRKLLNTKNLSEDLTNVLIRAAGRRFVRRQAAYAEAEQAVAAGRSQAATLEPLRREVELARKVCDFAESAGRSSSVLTAMAMAEAEMSKTLTYSPSAMMRLGLTDRFNGINTFTDADLKQLDEAFQARFGRPLPVSAKGDSAAHRALGFDHRGRVDVAVSPLQLEGVWLRRYLSDKGITFFAFSSAVRGKATGAHIHIGGASGRIGHTN